MGLAATRPSLRISFAVCVLLPLASLSARAQKVQYSSDHRDNERALPLSVSGGTARLRAKVSAGTGISLVAADFDSDGTPDLISGYATSTGGALLLQRGSSVAQAPTSRELSMTANGEFVTPFVSRAEPIDLPVRPDLLVAADIQGFGHQDLLAAQKGDSALYLIGNDGRGGFSAAQAVTLSGPVGAIGTWRAPSGDNFIVAGVCGAGGCGLQLLARDSVSKQFIPQAFVAMPGAVTSIQIGKINNGSHPDFAVIAGGKVAVIDGDSVLSSAPVIETLPVSNAASLALGTFVFDTNPGMQIAVLGSDATLHVITRTGVNSTVPSAQERAAMRTESRLRSLSHQRTRPAMGPKRTGLAWLEVETVHGVGSGGNSVTMLRGRFSGGGGDDLTVLSGTQTITVAHPHTRTGNIMTTEPVLTVDSSASTSVAAVATRVTPDSRLGIVSLNQGAHPLTVTPPTTPFRTITVQSYTDSTPTAGQISDCKLATTGPTCTLRAAVTVANEDRGVTPASTSQVDKIILKSGTTYTLLNTAYNTTNSAPTTAQTTDYMGSVNHRLELDGSANIVGSGCTNAGVPNTTATCTSTIDANQVDVVFGINFGSFYATSADDYESASTDVFFSGVAIKNGKNTNNCASGGDYCDFNGGLMNWDGEGGGNLVMTSVLLSGGNSPNSGGGAIDAYTDGTGTPGPLEIDNSTITGNTSPDQGGAVYAENGNALVLTFDYFYSNSGGQGGAVYDAQGGSTGQTDIITNSYFLSNTATSSGTGFGGGLYTEGTLNMSGTTFKTNTAQDYGGGVYANSENFTSTVTTSNFVGNALASQTSGHATNSAGGGMCLEGSQTSGQSVYTVHYSRFSGNTVFTGGASTGLGIGCGTYSGTVYSNVNASDNWWGCNGPASGTGCDTSVIGDDSAGATTLTLTPYTTLVLKLSSTTPTSGSSFNATGSLGQDSAGTVFSFANAVAYDGLTAAIAITQNSGYNTLTNTPGTTLTNSANPAVSYAAIYATATASSAGTGLASTTVDGCTIKDTGATPACNSSTTSNFTVSAPDMNVTSTHSGNFKAGDTADTYTLTAANIGTASTSGQVTVVDTLPNSSFVATGLSGTGWSCTLASLTCTRSDTLASSVNYPVITLTVSVGSTLAGSYSNVVNVSGGGETNTSNDSASDPTIVVGQPTNAETFNPTTIAPNATSTVTFTLGNPSANTVSLTGVAFSDPLPTGLKISTAATTNCSGGTASGAVNATTIALSGGTIAAGATCTVTAGVTGTTQTSYTNTPGAVTATNANAGNAPSAMLTISVTPTRLVFTSSPATPITAGGNSGTFAVAEEDAAGNIVNTSGDQIVVKVTTAGYLQTYSANTTSGVATFNLSSTTLTSAGTYTYTATFSGLTNGVATETVNPGAAASLVVSGYPTSTTVQVAGSALVKAIDQYGNTVTGFTGTVTLTTSDATATITPVSYTYVAADAGSHSFSVTFNTAGTDNIAAHATGLTGNLSSITVGDAIWVLAATGQGTEITEAGTTLVSAIGTAGTASTFGGVAIDGSGNVWSVASATNALAFNTYTGGGVTTFTGGGISTPVGVATDGLGQVWVVNSGASTVSAFSNAGVALSPTSGFSTEPTGAGTTGSTGIAIDISGSVWVTNGSANTITRILGAAAPVVSPISVGVKNVTLGSRP